MIINLFQPMRKNVVSKIWTAQNSIVIYSSSHFDKEKTPGLLCTNLLIIEYWKSNIPKDSIFETGANKMSTIKAKSP